MSAELFPSTPYEDFELREPAVVEFAKPVEIAPHPQLDMSEWLGPVALFAVRHDGEFDLEQKEAA